MAKHEHDHDHEHEAHGPDEGEPTREQVERAIRKRFALSQIRQYGDPALRMRANEVETFDEELQRLVSWMTDLMHDADGIGLAATQVGILRRIFVFHDEDEDRVLVNPRITKTSKATETEEEGCLSLGAIRVPVERPLEVTIEGQDAAGALVKYELEGLSARAVQHELDHLDGKLILDRTDPASRREALAQLRPKLVLSR